MKRAGLPDPRWIILVLYLLAGTGCFGASQTTSYQIPVGSDARTGKIEVKLLRGVGGPAPSNSPQSSCPTQTQQVLIATVTDASGKPQSGRRVEWRLEGCGSLLESDQGLFGRNTARPDEHAALTHTNLFAHKIGRNIGHPTDDILISPGQTWCMIGSNSEGETRVTTTAPEITSPDNNHSVMNLHWFSAEWTLPSPAMASYGVPQLLTSRVFRQSNSQQGLPGYRVRYRILDGPQAVFIPGQAPDVIVTTDPTGAARIRVAQAAPGLGRNHIAIEVLSPPLTIPSSPADQARDLVDAVLGQGQTIVDWQLPAVSLREQVPASIHLGQQVTATLTLANNGTTAARFLTVRATCPDGLDNVQPNPPASQDGKDIVWTLGQLAAQGRQSLELRYRPTRIGAVAARVRVTSSENGAQKVWDERTLQTQVLPTPVARLRVEDAGPSTGLLVRNSTGLQAYPIQHQVTVSNQGTDAAVNVRLRVELPAGLESPSGVNPLEWPLGTLAPGTARTVPLDLRPTKSGAVLFRLTAVADGQVQAQAEQKISIRETGVSVKLTGPATRYVGKPFDWSLAVTNNGTAALVQVSVSDMLPAELDLTKASDGGRLQGHEVLWILARLNPGETRTLLLTTQANAVAPQAVNRARVTAAALETEKGPEALLTSSRATSAGTPVTDQADAKIVLQGVPAFKLRVTGKGPVEVGEQTAYTIEVANTGSLPGSGLQVACTVPPQMRILSAVSGQFLLQGQKITFAPVANLVPGQTLRYVIDVQAAQAGDARFRAELTSSTMQQPIAKENSIHIVGQ